MFPGLSYNESLCKSEHRRPMAVERTPSTDDWLAQVTELILLLLSERTPLERCCVHNMSPFVSSSGLSPGSREAKVQRAKVCLNCTEPSVARSSCWSLPVGRYLSDTHCKGSMVVLARWAASNMAEETLTRWESGEQPVILLTSAFHTWRVSLTSCALPMCQMHRGERAGTLWWPKSRNHTSKLAQYMSERIDYWQWQSFKFWWLCDWIILNWLLKLICWLYLISEIMF